MKALQIKGAMMIHVLELCGNWGEKSGGEEGNRTPDTRIFSPLLYQLSYHAMFPAKG